MRPFLKNLIPFVIVAVAIAGPVVAEEALPKENDEAKRLSESIIYSVNRTPERTLETSRADKVITSEEIRRMNARGLADVLEEQAGVAVASWHAGGSPIIRGLSGKQIMILIDGVKVNNATWGSDLREYLNIIELSQIDRIEIVRGVVSVLGTESLGGVINIITKKGAPDGKGLGGSIGARYASGDSSLSAPIQVHGDYQRLRFNAGVSYGDFDDLRGGDGIGSQARSSYNQRGGFINGQFLVSAEKTIHFGYQNVEQREVELPAVAGVFASANSTPKRLQLGSLSYQDLTSRGWADSLRLTAFWNRQSQIVTVSVRPGFPNVDFVDGDVLGGLSLELGTFVGSHHLVYGVDSTVETADSAQRTVSPATGELVFTRGQQMDGSKYRSTGIYLQDRFNVSKWLTVVAGARYGLFNTSGHETTALGELDLDSSKSDVTGALNLIAHVTPKLNVIGNVFRGFRAPNLNDTSRFTYRTYGPTLAFEVMNPAAEPERVLSYEGGLKYDSGNFAASAFVFRNKLSNLLTIVPGVYNGLPFLDSNGNGRRDQFEFPIVQNRNVGEATIRGYELEAGYALPHGFDVWAHYASATGTDTIANQPLSSVPGGFGAAGVRYTAVNVYRPWVDLVWRHQQRQERVSAADKAIEPSLVPNGRPGFSILNIRTGISLTERFSATVALENVFNERYRQAGALFYGPGRNFIVGTQFNF